MFSPKIAAREPQRAEALARANQVRIARAGLRQELQRRTQTAPALLAEILTDPPSYVATLEIGEVLAWLPGWSDRTVDPLLRRHHINPLAAIAGERTTRTGCVAVLTARQRGVLALELFNG